jgi:beta-alanine degradation protein BauB
MTRIQAVPTVQISNDRVIVTEWRFAPGAETGWHLHAHDYVVVPTTDGELLLETPQVGVEHNVINNSAHEVVFIEIEIR